MTDLHGAGGHVVPHATALEPGADPGVLAVDTGALHLGFLPGAGGRLLSIRCGSVEFLWRNPAS